MVIEMICLGRMGMNMAGWERPRRFRSGSEKTPCMSSKWSAETSEEETCKGR
jgi:hypothetical protein